MREGDRIGRRGPGPLPRWSVVMPLKPPSTGKTRLRGSMVAAHPDTTAAEHRAITRLVLAMARDTVAATLACPAVHRVVLVCDDGPTAAALAGPGVSVLADSPAAGINAAMRHGAANGTSAGPVACLMPDLPALLPVELAAALAAAERALCAAGPAPGAPGPALTAAELAPTRGCCSGTPDMVFVPDAAGTGTVLLAAATAEAIRPAFGEASASAHLAAGARRLSGHWPGLSTDIDTAADLDAAAMLGLGRHTAAALAALGQR